MSDAAQLERVPQGEEAGDPSERPSTRLRRDADLLGRRDSAARKWLTPKISAIVSGFEEQADRSDHLDDWWNIYNCEIDDNQFYNGTAQVYVPIIHDAVVACVTRWSNQMFPVSGRYVECTASDGHQPQDIMALVNHYVREGSYETQVVKPMLRNAIVEGQINLYMDWEEIRRQLVSRETHGVIDPQTGMEMPGQEVESIDEDDVVIGRPVVQVLHDADVLILPQTADNIDQALHAGGSVTIVRRWSKTTLERMQDQGELEKSDDDSEGNRQIDSTFTGLSDLPKQLAKSIGIRAKSPHTLMLETWLMVPLNERGAFAKDGEPRLCRLWWDLERNPRGLRRNPFWNDRCPLLSRPLEKIAGLVKGKSRIEPLAQIQYEANDAANERADADHFGAMPIIARKPESGNAPLVLNLAAVWDVAPGDVQFMAFPDLSQRANARIMTAMQVINTSLGVNPAMLPGQTGRPGAKRNQAEIAMEQQVDMLTVAEEVKVPTAVMTEVAQWIVDLDHQFRDNDLLVRRFGEMGIRAEMQAVAPLRNRSQYWFAWAGSEQYRRNIAQQQGLISLLNVVAPMAPQLAQEGMKLRLSPAVQDAFVNTIGPLLASEVLVDAAHEASIAAAKENRMLAEGFHVNVHPQDNDQQHIQVHMQGLQKTMDPHGTFRLHIQAHIQAEQQKMAAAMAAAAQQMMGGAPQQGGMLGPQRPQPGTAVAAPRQPMGRTPGLVRPDNLPAAGALTMPRRM